MTLLRFSTLPFFKIGNYGICVYCGDVADSLDHVIPKSYQSENADRAIIGFGPVAHACRDCNTKLSNSYFASFRERCEYARDALQKQAKPIFWHNWEIAHLDYSLRCVIRQQNAKRKWIQNRADFYECREFYLNLEGLTFEECLIVGSPDFHKAIYNYFSSILHDIKHVIYKHT